MILESIAGGTVIALAAIGTCSTCRCIRRKVISWFSPAQTAVPQPTVNLIDPTPSFTVELVRTVLEHQARREDQHRQQLSILLMQIASAPPRDAYVSTTSLASNAKPLPQPAESAEANGRKGTIARTLHRLIPALRR